MGNSLKGIFYSTPIKLSDSLESTDLFLLFKNVYICYRCNPFIYKSVLIQCQFGMCIWGIRSDQDMVPVPNFPSKEVRSIDMVL